MGSIEDRNDEEWFSAVKLVRRVLSDIDPRAYDLGDQRLGSFTVDLAILDGAQFTVDFGRQRALDIHDALRREMPDMNWTVRFWLKVLHGPHAGKFVIWFEIDKLAVNEFCGKHSDDLLPSLSELARSCWAE